MTFPTSAASPGGPPRTPSPAVLDATILPPPATRCVVACFLGAVAGILLTSSLPAWTPWLAAAAALAAFAAARWPFHRAETQAGDETWTGDEFSAPPPPPPAAWTRAALPLALFLTLFTLADQVEQLRQQRNAALVEALFHAAPPPFDAAGAAPTPDLAWLTDRDEPRIRLATITGTVVEAPPPPMPRHLLMNRPRIYIVETQTVADPGHAPETLHARIHVALATNPLLPPALTPGPPCYPLPGDRIEATLALREILPGAAPPGQSDPHLTWLIEGLHAEASLDPRQWRELPGPAWVGPLQAARRAQDFLSAQVNRHLTGREADTIRALCWGDSSDLGPDDRRSFQRTGTVHLLAISGLHIYIVLYMLLLFLRPWLAHRAARHLALAVLIWTYAALTGFHEPVLRAVLMFTIWIGALLASRRFDPLNAWALSGLFILAGSPQSAHTIGFQMSYASVGMLCWWSAALTGWLRTRLLGRLDRWLLPRVLDGLCHALAAGLIALAATLPLTVYYFGVFPIWAVLANLVLVPIFELLLVLALPLTLLFCVTDPGWPALLLQHAAHCALLAADGMAALVGSDTPFSPPRPAFLVAALAALAVAGGFFRRAARNRDPGRRPPLGESALRARMARPSFSLALSILCTVGCSHAGAWPRAVQPTAAPAFPSAAAPVMILGRTHPCCVLARVPAPDQAGAAAPAGAAPAGCDAFTDIEPPEPEALLSAARTPVHAWHALLAPDVRDRSRLLAPGIRLFCDGPTARDRLLETWAALPLPAAAPSAAASATTAPDGRELLLVFLTPDSIHAPPLSPEQQAALAAHVTAVVLLDSAWRLLAPDGQAWVAFGRAHRIPVLAADAAPLWRLPPGGATATLATAQGDRIAHFPSPPSPSPSSPSSP
ncbi:MAG: ComEC/Rec2 family competence protein [Planctomycetota bacterium]